MFRWLRRLFVALRIVRPQTSPALGPYRDAISHTPGSVVFVGDSGALLLAQLEADVQKAHDEFLASAIDGYLPDRLIPLRDKIVLLRERRDYVAKILEEQND